MRAVKGTRAKYQGSAEDLANAKPRKPARRAAPVHAEQPAEPTRVRHAAACAPRAGAERHILDVQMVSRFLPVLQLQEHALEKRDGLHAPRCRVVCREVLELFVGFATSAVPNGIRTVLSRAVVGRNVRIQIVCIAPALEVLGAFIVDPVHAGSGNNDEHRIEPRPNTPLWD